MLRGGSEDAPRHGHEMCFHYLFIGKFASGKDVCVMYMEEELSAKSVR